MTKSLTKNLDIVGMVAQVCPQLKLPLIRRMLLNFVPDEFAPDPIFPSLVAAINTEVDPAEIGKSVKCSLFLSPSVT